MRQREVTVARAAVRLVSSRQTRDTDGALLDGTADEPCVGGEAGTGAENDGRTSSLSNWACGGVTP